MDDSEKLGGRFWLALIGGCIAVALAVALLFWLFGTAWYAWGLAGALICFGGVALAVGWIADRRERNRRLSV